MAINYGVPGKHHKTPTKPPQVKGHPGHDPTGPMGDPCTARTSIHLHCTFAFIAVLQLLVCANMLKGSGFCTQNNTGGSWLSK